MTINTVIGMLVLATFVFTVGWAIGLNTGFKNGGQRANERMVDDCFRSAWVYLDVGSTQYAFHCDTSHGHTTITRK